MTNPQTVREGGRDGVAPFRQKERSLFPAVLAPDDATLIARMGMGDKGAMAPFYARWEASVRTALFLKATDSMNTDDVVEDVFWHAWCQAKTFNPARVTAKKWLLDITRSVCTDRCRRAMRGDDRYGAW
ncbi:MAG TPA: sigma factor [Gemmatimonadaceae bacterium]|nr:sigma factor [Gemmatimonadaceae bacterium]